MSNACSVSCSTTNAIVDVIQVDPEESLLMERYYFERVSVLSLVNQNILQSEFHVNEDRFRKLIDEYVLVNTQYVMYWGILEKKYLKPRGYSVDTYEVNLNFDFNELEVKIKGMGGSCSCSNGTLL